MRGQHRLSELFALAACAGPYGVAGWGKRGGRGWKIIPARGGLEVARLADFCTQAVEEGAEYDFGVGELVEWD